MRLWRNEYENVQDMIIWKEIFVSINCGIMPFLQVKNFFSPSVMVHKIFQIDTCNSYLSNLETFKLMDRVCFSVVLFLISGICRKSVRLGNISR